MAFEDKILPEKEIPYYEETQKRTLTEKYRKIKNTFLSLLAYSCPVNSWRIQLHRWRGVNIGNNVFLGSHCHLDNLYPEYIFIEDNASINSDTMLLTHFNPMKRFSPIMQAKVAPIYIGEGAILAVRSTVLPGVKIGKNAIVSAGSIVDKDVPEYSLVSGNPAKIKAEYKTLMS